MWNPFHIGGCLYVYVCINKWKNDWMAFLLQTKNYRHGGDSNLQKWDLQSHVVPPRLCRLLGWRYGWSYMCQAWRVARRGQASNLSGRKLRPGMTNLYFRDTGLVSANTGSEFSHWSGWALKTVCAVMRTESAGVDLKVDGEEGSWGGNGMSTGTGHVCIFRCAGRLLPLPVARAGCMATVAMKLSYVSLLESGGVCSSQCYRV